MKPTNLLEKLHKMSPKRRMKWFNAASKNEIESVTDSCPGEAHSNPHIDYCLTCLGTTWGRVLKPLNDDKV